MFAFFLSEPQYMPCPECGVAVAREDTESHVCHPERWADVQLFRLRPEFDLIELEFAEYLATPQGRFAVWLAERDRLAVKT